MVLEKNDVSGLKFDSVLRLHRLTTIPFELIKRQLGDIPTGKRKEVQDKLVLLFGIK